jgi:hypothetical protein
MPAECIPNPTQKNHATERQAFTIGEFCARNSISATTFHKLKKEGRGPNEMHLGTAIRISAEAKMVWRRARETPDEAELRLIQREQEARRRSARKAAKAAVASPHHVSKRHKRASVKS